MEKVLNEKLPECLVKILTLSGIESDFTIKHIDINTIESFVEENREIFDEILSQSIYKSIHPFKFAPGHRILLEKFPELIQTQQMQNIEINSSNFSVVLRALVGMADKNDPNNPQANRYNDIVRWFSVYIFLLCGRSCYETLSANLPIPKTSTICKSVF